MDVIVFDPSRPAGTVPRRCSVAALPQPEDGVRPLERAARVRLRLLNESQLRLINAMIDLYVDDGWPA
jgi:hypothetical protein